jgi:hypothetical protein
VTSSLSAGRAAAARAEPPVALVCSARYSERMENTENTHRTNAHCPGCGLNVTVPAFPGDVCSCVPAGATQARALVADVFAEVFPAGALDSHDRPF